MLHYFHTQRFTPVLSETYERIQEKSKESGDVEFVLVTGDVTEDDFDVNRQKMPFPAVPFQEAKGRLSAFKSFFQFETIPHLVVIMPNGKVSNGNAKQAVYNDVYNDRLGEHFPWWDNNTVNTQES